MKGLRRLQGHDRRAGPGDGLYSAARQTIAGLRSEVAAGAGHEETAGRLLHLAEDGL